MVGFSRESQALNALTAGHTNTCKLSTAGVVSCSH